VRALLQPESLSADTYFFLLHVLIALLTGNNDSTSLVQHLINATATSPEYPNAIFINQLTYLVLMHLGDPLGPYGWNNAQLQTAVSDLSGVVANTGPAAQTIQTSLARQAKILYSAASYPLVDPYNPGIGFNQRMADTRSALDRARTSLHTAMSSADNQMVDFVIRPTMRAAATEAH